MSWQSRIAGAWRALRGTPQARSPGPPPVRPSSTNTLEVPGERGKRPAQLPVDRVRWLRADVEHALRIANSSGRLFKAGQLSAWNTGDLFNRGLYELRCSVPRLPRQWTGDMGARLWLQGTDTEPGVFDDIFPPDELMRYCIDRLDLGVGVGFFKQPEGAALPRFVRLPPEWLEYLHGENRWRYRAYHGTLDIDPGNGVWLLHTNGEIDPWRNGHWFEMAMAKVSAEGGGLARDGFAWKFGSPIVVAVAPNGASENQMRSWHEGWLNPVMATYTARPGYDAKLLQAKAEGREIFNDQEKSAQRKAMVALLGQEVSVTGGVGFANADVFKNVANSKLADTAIALASNLNEQGLPPLMQWASRPLSAGGLGLLAPGASARLAYNTTPPEQRKAEAESNSAVAKSVIDLTAAGFDVNREEVRSANRLPAAVAPDREPDTSESELTDGAAESPAAPESEEQPRAAA